MRGTHLHFFHIFFLVPGGAVINDTKEILNGIQIGLDVAIFLLKTDRVLQATELLKECLILLIHLDFGIHLDISKVQVLNDVGILTRELGDKYRNQNRFVEATF